LITKITQDFDYECALMGLGGGGVDPAAQINVLRSSGELHQWFPRQSAPANPWEARIDGLLNSLMRTTDYGERKKAFDEIQAIMADELPMIYTISPLAFGALAPNLRNVRPAVLSPYRLTWNIEELYLEGPR
jgi:peptide/nickel transport system substrate-binding protein